MSYFSAPLISGNGDIKKIHSYIRMLNQQLQYCFGSIDPEDNFSLDALVKYRETDTKIAQLEINIGGFIAEFKDLEEGVNTSLKVLDGQIALKVSVDELCSEISLSPDTVTFRSGYVVFDTKNFKLDVNGNAEFSGAVKGGSINIMDNFVVDDKGTVRIKAGTFSEQVICTGLLYTNYMRVGGDADISGTVSCNRMNVTGTVSCEELYQTSDRRLKKEITAIPDPVSLKTVLGLRPVTFRYKESNIRSMGFIAQEVNDMQARNDTDLPLTERMGDGYYAIPYGNYAALYAGAIREQQREIEKLEKEVAEYVSAQI